MSNQNFSATTPTRSFRQSVAGQSVAGQSVAGQSVAGQSVAGQSVAGQSVAGQSYTTNANSNVSRLNASNYSNQAGTSRGTSYGSPQAASSYGSPQTGPYYGSTQAGSSYGPAQTGSSYGSTQRGPYYGSIQAGSSYGSIQAGSSRGTSYGSPQAATSYGSSQTPSFYGSAQAGSFRGTSYSLSQPASLFGASQTPTYGSANMPSLGTSSNKPVYKPIYNPYSENASSQNLSLQQSRPNSQSPRAFPSLQLPSASNRSVKTMPQSARSSQSVIIADENSEIFGPSSSYSATSSSVSPSVIIADENSEIFGPSASYSSSVSPSAIIVDEVSDIFAPLTSSQRGSPTLSQRGSPTLSQRGSPTLSPTLSPRSSPTRSSIILPSQKKSQRKSRSPSPPFGDLSKAPSERYPTPYAKKNVVVEKYAMDYTIGMNDKRQLTSNCLVFVNAKSVKGEKTGDSLYSAIEYAFVRYCAANKSKICNVTGSVIQVEGKYNDKDDEEETITTYRAVTKSYLPLQEEYIDEEGNIRLRRSNELYIVPIDPLIDYQYSFYVREYFTHQGKSVPWFFVWTSHPSLANLLCGFDENGGHDGPKLMAENKDKYSVGFKFHNKILRATKDSYTDSVSANANNKIIVKLANGPQGLSTQAQLNFVEYMSEELESFISPGESVSVDIVRKDEQVYVVFAVEPKLIPGTDGFSQKSLHEAQLRMAMFVWFNNDILFSDIVRREEFRIPMYYVKNL